MRSFDLALLLAPRPPYRFRWADGLALLTLVKLVEKGVLRVVDLEDIAERMRATTDEEGARQAIVLHLAQAIEDAMRRTHVTIPQPEAFTIVGDKAP